MKLSIRKLNKTELEKVNEPNHPCVAVILTNDDGVEQLTLNYLYLMRGYSFQIGGLNANGCTVDTTVIGFGNIIHAFHNYKRPDSRSSLYASNVYTFDVDDNSIVIELFNGQAVACVMKLIQRYTNKEWLQEKLGSAGLEMAITAIDESIGKCQKGYQQEDTVWQKFIRDSVKYVLKAYEDQIKS